MAYELRKVEGSELRGLYNIVRDEYRALAKIPLWMLLLAESRGHQECFVIEDEIGYAVGYAVCSIKSLYGYVLLNLLELEYGVKGDEIVKALETRYNDRQGIIVELVVKPGEIEEFQRKLNFYRRCGFAGVRANYILAGETARLMVRPIRGPWDISPVAHRVIPEIYSNIIPAPARRRIVNIKALDIGKKVDS